MAFDLFGKLKGNEEKDTPKKRRAIGDFDAIFDTDGNGTIDEAEEDAELDFIAHTLGNVKDDEE